MAREDHMWQGYTKDDTVLYDQYHSKLQTIDDIEELCQDKIFYLLYELDENIKADEVRKKSLRSMSDDSRKRVKTNSKEDR